MSKGDKASRPDDENPEWTDDMFAKASRPGDLPPSLQAKMRRGAAAPETRALHHFRLDLRHENGMT